MDVFIVKSSNPQPRGYLGQFLFEIQRGIFVGSLSRRVAEQLYKKLANQATVTSLIWVRSYPNDQGFITKIAGSDALQELPVLDFEGTENRTK